MSYSSEWRTHRLDEVATLVGGGTPSRAVPEYFGGSIPWVTPTDLAPIGRVEVLGQVTETITSEGLNSSSAKLISPGTVLFSSRASIGKIAISDRKCATNQGFVNFVPDLQKLDSWFLGYALLHHLPEIIKLCGETTFKEVPRGKLKEFEMSFPPLDEQCRIVARIQDCFSRLEEMEELQADALRDAKRLSLNYFRHTYEKLIQELPTRPLREIASVQGGGTPSRDRKDYWTGDVPWVSPKDMKVWEIMDAQEHVSLEGINGSAAKLLNPPAVLFVVRGMILAHTLPIAVTRVPVAINQDMKALIPRGMSADFLAAMLLGASATLLRQVEIAGHGTRRLQTEKWTDLPIPIPGKAESRLIAEFQKVRDAAREIIANSSSSQISQLRSAILREAFAGRL